MKRFILGCMLFMSSSLFGGQNNDHCGQYNHYNLHVDWLFFRASGESLDVASVSTGTSNDPDIPRITSDDWKRIEICPDWDSGYRIGLSTDLQCMRVFGEWSWYSTDKGTSFHFTGPSSDTQTFEVSSDFLGISNQDVVTYDLSSKFHFRYYRLDLGVEKNFIECNNLSLSAFTAFTYYQTNQDLKAEDNEVFTSPSDTSRVRTFKGNTQYNGFGASLGCNLDWKIFNCFSLYSKGSVSAVYGSNDVSYNYNRTSDQFAGFDNTFHFSYDKSRGRYVAGIQVGLRAQTCICGCYQLYGNIGWESQVLFDQTDWMVKTNMNFPQGDKSSANLYLQGLVIRGGISF